MHMLYRGLSRTLTLFLLIGLLGCSNNLEVGSVAYIKNDTVLYDRPGGNIIREDVLQGRVVTVQKKQGSWVEIVIYTYDTPSDNVGWVETVDVTNSKEGLELIEGRLKREQILMDGPPPNGKPRTDKVGKKSQVHILKRTEGWVHGQFAGGLDGWIPENCVEYVGPE